MIEKKIENIFVNGAMTPEFIADSIAKHSSKTDIGGHSLFLGQVRKDEIEGKLVSAIEYTVYKEIALVQMQQIREDIFKKYPISYLQVYQSLGIVKTGEVCLFVFASAAHRKPAIEACEEAVERLKSELPIWGKEIFEDGTHQWKENK